MKAIMILAILALIVVAGCTGTTAPKTEQKVSAEVVTVDPAVKDATSGLVDNSDNVEIGEMV